MIKKIKKILFPFVFRSEYDRVCELLEIYKSTLGVYESQLNLFLKKQNDDEKLYDSYKVVGDLENGLSRDTYRDLYAWDKFNSLYINGNLTSVEIKKKKRDVVDDK
jgi:hypothetical protein